MQLGEAAADNVANESHDEDCYFCNGNPDPTPNLNSIDDETDEDSDFDSPTKFKNDAGTLGTNLGGKPDPEKVMVQGKSKPVSVAAHHLIPGNASLKNSSFFKQKKYLWKAGKAKGNIGYNVNARTNGVWLPGNYAIRPWSDLDAVFQSEYAEAAILKWGSQFHDAHEKYSEFVRDVLNKVFDKLNRQESIVCEKARKKKNQTEEDKDPMIQLVSRFHTISLRMRGMLVAPSKGWKRNVWTSRFSKSFMKTRKGHIDAK